MKFLQLDREKLGNSLVGIVPASVKGKHSWPRSTVVDYLDPELPEDEFIIDLFKLSTSELVEKWYGGEDEILNLIVKASVFSKKDID